MEPRITINGTPLTEAQAMTLRVAAGSFALDLRAMLAAAKETGKFATRRYQHAQSAWRVGGISEGEVR